MDRVVFNRINRISTYVSYKISCFNVILRCLKTIPLFAFGQFKQINKLISYSGKLWSTCGVFHCLRSVDVKLVLGFYG